MGHFIAEDSGLILEFGIESVGEVHIVNGSQGCKEQAEGEGETKDQVTG
jgi:hypothetical protein